MNKENINIPASIHRRLKNIAKEKNESLEDLLYRYMVERFLYRLSQSKYKEKFYLKGACLFWLWEEIPHRPTRDIDFLGIIPGDIILLEKIFAEISSLNIPEDGLLFVVNSIKGEEIREGQTYGGIRLKQAVMLGKARLILQVDIGYGDVVTPQPEDSEFPTLLKMPAPKIKTYPLCTVIAEKLEIMVIRDIENSRMKDFYDLWFLTKNFDINKTELLLAIKRTFGNRKTIIPVLAPIALTLEFAENEQKQIQWKAFLKKNQINVANTELNEIILHLNSFFMPILDEINLTISIV